MAKRDRKASIVIRHDTIAKPLWGIMIENTDELGRIKALKKR